jgi:LPXTG-motif cell wall-anchored protein
VFVFGVLVLGALPPGWAGAASPEDERVATLEPPNPVPSGEVLVSLSGWPAACSVVELHYVEGGGGAMEGEVLGSWGSLELTEGAGSKTVTAPGPAGPGATGEYNLRVTGDTDVCGEPYFTPDFAVYPPQPPPPPQPFGNIKNSYEPEDPYTGIRVEAEEWGDDCPSLDVRMERRGVVVVAGVLHLESGQGTLTAPPSLLLAFDPPDNSDDFDFWLDLIAEGPVDRCGGPYQTELLFRRPWPPAMPSSTTTTAPITSVVPATAVAPPTLPSGGDVLPETGSNKYPIPLIAAALTLGGAAMLIARRRSVR